MRFTDASSLSQYRDRLCGSGLSEAKTLWVCGGTGCRASGSLKVLAALEAEAQRRQLPVKVGLKIKTSGCHGFCQHGPLVVYTPDNIFYQKVRPEDAADIVEKTVLRGELIPRLLYRDPATGETLARVQDIPFYQLQKRVALFHSGQIDPESSADYIAAGGYVALARALTTMTPDDVISEIELSGLRGRGGAGFPTGLKWKTCRQAALAGELPYVIANGDEGDPGAFMDRSIMEGDPHSIIEGMVIGAYAIGAKQGYIYVRAEYPLAVKHLQQALTMTRAMGLLGENILGTSFSFDISLYRGGGAFVCGESTALMASIEGRPGEPRVTYIRSVEKGLYGRPTVLNNVETWANVPHIINRGWKWFKELGASEKSPGTKVFSLVGKVKNTGLVEVPMGTSLRKIVYDIGGGPERGRKLKAIQTGGPSGGCIPEHLIDVAVDFEHLDQAGAMMGSGGLIVMDERTCMVDIARYFLEFLGQESCGKCLPCREGIPMLLDLLTDLTLGKGQPGDIELIEELALGLKETALCGLGQTAANPVLSTLQYFRHEYEEHLAGFCRAGVCPELFRYEVDPKRCQGCGACSRVCPTGSISGQIKAVHRIDNSTCTRCGSCVEVCRFNAILVKPLAVPATGRIKKAWDFIRQFDPRGRQRG
ncbi:MAG: NADH-quinone oxidoreductase subunit NuoF [Firmicutes bacterium]|nr:NADH-quinone oxidoreductase subunit NuoF [Bacillota bacterium]